MHHIIPIIYYYHYHYFVDNDSLISDNRWLIVRAVIDIIITSVNGSLQQVQWVIVSVDIKSAISRNRPRNRGERISILETLKRKGAEEADFQRRRFKQRGQARGFYQGRGIFCNRFHVSFHARQQRSLERIFLFFSFPHPGSSEILIPA